MYHLIKVKTEVPGEVVALIIGTGYARIEEYLPSMSRNLEGFRGEVVFDLLLNNGSNDRYYGLGWSDCTGHYFSPIDLQSVRQSVVEASEEFLRSNIHLIDNSVILTKPQKLLIKRLLNTVEK